ncbi:dGTPase [Desulfitispora alkaliphila]|uniref:deoxyguanosinetriphosphate triphosphohydrolase n=1 Tax=Desulfitispora alkaliphila TaxID=622674 RepID=UPI003D24A2F7
MVTVREDLEKLERQVLSPYAALSAKAARDRMEEKCPFRTDIQRDRDRIIHSKAFRRLKHKTQVFVAPTGDHYRTRLTHTLEVAQISRTIAKALKLNEDLVEAIALGHDVGHTPFGHAGEFALRKILGHYNHNEQSVHTVENLERLNLTEWVRDGILCHTGKKIPSTQEGQIVRIGDRIAYLCHDFDDSLRAGLIKKEQLPALVVEVLGARPSIMITTMVSDVIMNSMNKSKISMSNQVEEAMNVFREFMFDKIYLSSALEKERGEAEDLIFQLFDHFYKNPEVMPEEFFNRIHYWSLNQVVTDYIAGLTDQYAINLAKEIFGPKAIPNKIGLF